jgi:hypothetical protein
VVILTCHERDELERQVNAALLELARKSSALAEMANAPAPASKQTFDNLRTENAILTERLRVLRDCLILHKDAHGC